ncbi:hypothetical protein JHN63_21915 [Streptomyces sp. MBT65]|uniref:hypothetical protein n=1 Tax=Streptomyces sp. MBT65 TaxID=1488395 RepID=UPI00190C42EF|nr:hypothetical protein [Streptomyces sp. MBT65]MBK3576421.1 hypothetical protein [Streptomyces sp. MBT65]
MGTTLTPEFWRQFAVLLVIATVITVVVSAALDALVLRMRARRTSQRPPASTVVRTHRSVGRTPVHH